MKIDTSLLLPVFTDPYFGTENYLLFQNKENYMKIHADSPILFYKGS